jgi:hypothetical protein
VSKIFIVKRCRARAWEVVEGTGGSVAKIQTESRYRLRVVRVTIVLIVRHVTQTNRGTMFPMNLLTMAMSDRSFLPWLRATHFETSTSKEKAKNESENMT